jgi:hypothetical protein
LDLSVGLGLGLGLGVSARFVLFEREGWMDGWMDGCHGYFMGGMDVSYESGRLEFVGRLVQSF